MLSCSASSGEFCWHSHWKDESRAHSLPNNSRNISIPLKTAAFRRSLMDGRLHRSNRHPMTLHPGYAATRISSNLNGSTKQFGWLQASATRNYSAAIGPKPPATIQIDSPPPQHLDVASLRRSPMQSMTSYKLPGTNLLDEWIGDLPLIPEVVASQLAKITCPTGRQYIENRFQRQSASPGP